MWGLLVLTAPLTVIAGRCRFLTFALSLTAAVALCTSTGAARAAEWFQVDIITRLDAASSHDTYGLLLSLWRDAFLQAKTSPEDYSQAYMEDVLDRIDQLLLEDGEGEATSTASATQPNIIMVLLLSGLIARETKHYVYDGNLEEVDDTEIPQYDEK